MNADDHDRAWQPFVDELRAFVHKRVNDPHTADDLAQDVLVKFAREVATNGPLANPAAWLFTTARHAVIDHYRTRRPTQALEAVPEVAEPEADGADLQRLQASFRTFVHALPGKYREALLLTEFEGLTQQQLADRLGVPLSTAKSRVQRGRAELAKALHDCCTFELDRRGGVVDYQRRQPGGRSDCC